MKQNKKSKDIFHNHISSNDDRDWAFLNNNSTCEKQLQHNIKDHSQRNDNISDILDQTHDTSTSLR